MAYCSNCGAKIEDNAKFCGECGTVLATHGAASTPTPSVAPASAENSTAQTDHEKLSTKEIEAKKRAESAKYAVDAAVGVAGSAISATASVAASGAAIVGEVSKRAMGGVNAANPETKKKVVGTLVLIAVLGAIAFGGKALLFTSSPETAIKEYYSALEKGDIKELLKFFPESKTAASDEEHKFGLKLLVKLEIPEAENSGGISSVEPVCAPEPLSKNRYNCKAEITYGDGSVRTNEHALAKVNGSWKVN